MTVLGTVFPHIRSAGVIFLMAFHSKVAKCKCAGIIRMRVLFVGGSYMRKYGKLNRKQKLQSQFSQSLPLFAAFIFADWSIPARRCVSGLHSAVD